MNDNTVRGKFYFNMGLLMLALVVAGFASAAFFRGTSPLDLPSLFHLHGIVFIAWAGLAFVVLRLVFIFTIGASGAWASLMDGIFGR